MKEEYLYIAISKNNFSLVREEDILVDTKSFVRKHNIDPVYFARIPKISEFSKECERSKKGIRPYGNRLIVFDTNRRINNYPVIDVCKEGELKDSLKKCYAEWLECSKNIPNPGFSITPNFTEQYFFVFNLPKYVVEENEGKKLTKVDSFYDLVNFLEENFEDEKPEEYPDDFEIGAIHGD